MSGLFSFGLCAPQQWSSGAFSPPSLVTLSVTSHKFIHGVAPMVNTIARPMGLLQNEVRAPPAHSIVIPSFLFLTHVPPMPRPHPNAPRRLRDVTGGGAGMLPYEEPPQGVVMGATTVRLWLAGWIISARAPPFFHSS